jgi:acyl carrier protein phosphodiesterase
MGRMNYLAHLFLSPPDDLSRLGNIMADFLRDVDKSILPEPVQEGIILHQRIDSFTDSHPRVRELRDLFSPQRKRFSGVVLDVVFDHFLIQHWDKYSVEDLDDFVEGSYTSLQKHEHYMSEHMQRVIGWMIKRDWIRSYRDLSGIEWALDGLASRLKMTHGFHGSIEEVSEHYHTIEQGFLTFFPELMQFAHSEQARPDE